MNVKACCKNGSSGNFITKDVTPSLRILQLNIEGITQRKCNFLRRLLKDYRIDIINLQETHTKAESDHDRKVELAGYTLVKAIHHPQYGIATYIKSSIKNVQLVTASDTALVFSIAVLVEKHIVMNVYKPPSVRWPATLLPVHSHPSVYMGDFNSHHTNWKYTYIDENGELLALWAKKHKLHLVFDAKDKGTFQSARWQKDYNPDLLFVSRDHLDQPLPCSRIVLPIFPNSQHRPILAEVSVMIPLKNLSPLPRWNISRSAWNGYREYLDQQLLLSQLQPMASNYEKFCEIIWAAVKSNLPMGFWKEYILKPSFKTKEELKGNEGFDDKLNVITTAMKELNTVKAKNILTKKDQQGHTILKKMSENHKSAKPFRIGEVKKAIKQLKDNEIAGPDNIFNELFRHMGSVAISWLASFFSDILANNTLPKQFILENVVAVLNLEKPEDLPESNWPAALLHSIHNQLQKLILFRGVNAS